jgi:hypothetical protein
VAQKKKDDRIMKLFAGTIFAIKNKERPSGDWGNSTSYFKTLIFFAEDQQAAEAKLMGACEDVYPSLQNYFSYRIEAVEISAEMLLTATKALLEASEFQIS